MFSRWLEGGQLELSLAVTCVTPGDTYCDDSTVIVQSRLEELDCRTFHKALNVCLWSASSDRARGRKFKGI